MATTTSATMERRASPKVRKNLFEAPIDTLGPEDIVGRERLGGLLQHSAGKVA